MSGRLWLNSDGDCCFGLVDGEGDGFEAGDEVEDATVGGWELLEGVVAPEGDGGGGFF